MHYQPLDQTRQILSKGLCSSNGRALASMREVRGSMPNSSILFMRALSTSLSSQ
ncbi:hypothetical protein HOLleu_28693 [Holothuria leucospilota]|uniref:Uncharacterized protein n=1 Tax=Holothuria leucospilota TaxID=206669 RepID=A0A9Q1H245_HOLLE|nr:hypothetical protein HOLleu_28693 [Holothuria leucospilota]